MTAQQPYELVRQTPGYELRRYPSHVVAETLVRDAAFEDAGNRAFRLLFGYISGENTARQSVEMTAPVVQSASSRIAMTAPVVQQQSDEGYMVAFVLPAGITEATAPVPARSEVTLRTVPERMVAAVGFSGRWTRESWDSHREALLASLDADGLTPVGVPAFARFDPPYKPWFLRHNEVLVEVDENNGGH
jgi:hypothetical protein